MQLHLLVPFFVMLYRINSKIGHFVMLVITATALWFTCYVVNRDQIRAGIFAIENYNMLDELFAPPWGHIFCTTMGVMMAYLYICILQYRNGASSPKIAYLHSHAWPSYMMIFTGLFLISFNLLIGHPAIANPYLWSTLENQLYSSVLRLTYVWALMLILTAIFTGKFNRGMYLLSGSNVRALGKITLVNAVICPIIISFLYDTSQDALYVSFNVTLLFGIGNAATCTIFSLLLVIFFDIPI